MTEYRIADVDPAFMDSLHDHKMFVATDIHQYHHRDLDLVQGFRRYPIATGPHAETFHVALHVEHGKALDADKVLIGV
ncbi:hypothetical protein D3C81_1853290 [compost metagenome]